MEKNALEKADRPKLSRELGFCSRGSAYSHH